MSPDDLRARLEAAGWEVVDMPRHHAMVWTAIGGEVCVTLRRDGTVSAWAHAINAHGDCEVHMTGAPGAVVGTIQALGLRL